MFIQNKISQKYILDVIPACYPKISLQGRPGRGNRDGRKEEPARPFCSRHILQEQRIASSANVRDKTDTAMHFHTFIRPGVRKIVDQNMNLNPAGSPAWEIIRLGARQ